MKIWKGLFESLRPMIRPPGAPSLQRSWKGISRFGWSVHGYRHLKVYLRQLLLHWELLAPAAIASGGWNEWHTPRSWGEDIAKPLIINQLWLVIKAALTRSKGREVVGLRVFKDWDRIVVALLKYLSWIFLFKSFTNPVIWGLFVDRFCLWNQGVSLLGYVLLRYD